MIWRLEYENAHGDVARLDIQRGAATPVEIIEGTENPFLLSYELEGKNKKGFIMSSFADISVYETPTFNIDDLKTSNETELSVKWYINSVLTWSGFVVPDFFSREIGEPAIVNLAASDRLSALKDSTLDGLAGYINMKDLLNACLEKTGLVLPLMYMVDFKTEINGSTIDFMYVVASAERLQDDKGKRISCYDILRSILVLSNSTIRQQEGHWTLINKIQHEAISPQLTFNEVYAGAKRTIQPVFSSVGAFQEFGGGDRYPKNYDFKVATGWTAKNGFYYVRENREILGYTIETIGPYEVVVAIPIYGAVTDNYQLFNKNNLEFYPNLNLDTSPYLESSKVLIPYDSTSIGIECILTATGLDSSELSSPFTVRFAVIAESDTEKLILNNDGVFVPFSNQRDYILGMTRSRYIGTESMVTKSATFKGKLTVDTNVSDYKISIRIYGDSVDLPTFIDSIYYKFKSDQDIGKGMLYRTEQIGVFSKKNDPETTIFGDYISNGLNGYFYPYPIEDTSILRSPVDTDLPSRLWTTATDPDSGELPILQHVARQNSRMFGVAHNILSAVIDTKTFNPLAIVTNCAGERYVIVAATFDFLRSTVEVELQQIAYGTLERRDFIYNYFGGEDDGIRSIGAATSGGGTSIGGGGSFLDKYFTFDEGNDALVANVNLVSEKEIAAYFADGSIPSIFDSIPFATSAKVGGIKASSTYQNGIRINSSGFLEIDPSYADSGVSSWNDLTNRPTWLTPTTKALFEAAHGHTWGQITSKPTTLAGFGITDAYTKTSIDAFFAGTIAKTGYNKSNWDTVVTDFAGLEIGGRNLLLDSGRTVSNGDYNIARYDLTDKPKEGERVTVTIKGTLAPTKSNFRVYNSGGSVLMGTLSSLGGGIYRLTFNWIIGSSNNTYLNVYAFTSSQSGTSTIEWIKLEKGNKATDWSPAPEDQVSDWNTTDVNSFSFIKNKPINPVTGTGTAGQVSYWNGAGSQAGSANLVWDNTNSRLGIGGAPLNPLHLITDKHSNSIQLERTGVNASTWKIGFWGTGLAFSPTAGSFTDASTLILSDGKIGINKVSDGNALDVNGIGSFSTGLAICKTTVIPGYRLDVNGAIRAAGNIYATGNITGAGEVTAYTASDARLKTNITSLASINALDIINALNPVTYTWNSRAVQLNGSKNTTSINYGLIAQELEQIVPDLIRPIYGDYKTYDDRGLMAIMLQAIKELKAEVDLLKNKN